MTKTENPSLLPKANADECFTVVFRGNLRKLQGNPHHYETQFGPVMSITMGDAMAPPEEHMDVAGLARTLIVEMDCMNNLPRNVARALLALDAALPDDTPQEQMEIRHGLETGEAKPDNASETAGGPAPQSRTVSREYAAEVVHGAWNAGFEAGKAVSSSQTNMDGPTYLDFITPEDVFDKGSDAVKAWQEAERARITNPPSPQRHSKRDRQRLQSAFKKGVKEGRRIEREAALKGGAT